jgi:hypothetical protein
VLAKADPWRLQLGWLHQSTFVDDTAQADLPANIRASIHASEQAANAFLGHPSENRRPSCISEEKWRETAAHLVEFLVFEVCTRTMMVRWPVPKRLALKQLIEDKWQTLLCRLLPRDIASLLALKSRCVSSVPIVNGRIYSVSEIPRTGYDIPFVNRFPNPRANSNRRPSRHQNR